MLITYLKDIEDFRRPQARKYELHFVLLFSIVAILCNAKSYRDISRFIKNRFMDLKHDFSLDWEKPPAYTTIRNIIKGVCRQELEAAFRAYTASLADYHLHPPQQKRMRPVAIDGKVLRGSFDHFNDQCAIQQLMFFDTERFLILGHVEIADKTNEIPVAQSLVGELELLGALYTMDALHCQKKLLKHARKAMAC